MTLKEIHYTCEVCGNSFHQRTEADDCNHGSENVVLQNILEVQLEILMRVKKLEARKCHQ